MNIIIAGSSGFLGQHLAHLFRQNKIDFYGVPHKAYDLRNQSHINALFKHTGKPDVIYHLAAHIGGIEYNLKHPAELFYDNIIMNTQLIQKAAIAGVGKFIFVSSVCAYPQFPLVPTNEGQLWHGPIEVSNQTYGISKLIVLSQLQACKKQYGMKFEYPILANLYGPGDSGFFNESKAHLLPNLIRKFMSDVERITIFGRGKLSRDFLYVGDAAQALYMLLNTNVGQELNFASGAPVTKRELVEMLVEFTGYKGIVEYDGKVDKGQLKRWYDIELAKKLTGWKPETTFYDGLKETVRWYAENRCAEKD